jgi:Cu-Zn family superoxide dismutase
VFISISDLLKRVPCAKADIKGNRNAPHLSGSAKFYPWANGTIVKIELINLPIKPSPFAVHIHEGKACVPDDFSKAGGHLNPEGLSHPAHAGDLPSIFSNNGYGYMIIYTDRFRTRDIIGKPIIIHMDPDDYRTQPAGNSGERIGCGIIKK